MYAVIHAHRFTRTLQRPNCCSHHNSRPSTHPLPPALHQSPLGCLPPAVATGAHCSEEESSSAQPCTSTRHHRHLPLSGEGALRPPLGGGDASCSLFGGGATTRLRRWPANVNTPLPLLMLDLTGEEPTTAVPVQCQRGAYRHLGPVLQVMSPPLPPHVVSWLWALKWFEYVVDCRGLGL
jgi:hypothetical protein